jgi:outer membrane protein insertion porin family
VDLKKIASKLIWVLLISFLSPVGLAQEQMEVKEIVIEGNKLVSLEEIKGAIPFKVGDLITEEELEEGRLSIGKLGYFRDVEWDYIRVEEGIKVIYRVFENPPVKEIKIVGNEKYDHSFKLFGIKIPLVQQIIKTDRLIEILKEKGVEKGKILNLNSLKEGLDAILEEYQKKGYVLVGFGEIRPEEEIFIEIIERKIESIEVTGLQEVPKEIAFDLIRIPLLVPAKIVPIQQSALRINRSIYFEAIGLEDISFEEGSAKDKVKMIWNLKERKLLPQPQEIKGIEFVGYTVYSEEELKEALGELPEGLVNNYQLLTALKGIHELYLEDGYTLVKLSAEEFDQDQGMLVVRISEGVIDSIEIMGNERTKDYVILKEIKLSPGEVFNEIPLQESYRNLVGLEYFEDVQMDFEEVDSKIKLVVKVIEREKLGTFSGALSYAEGGIVGKLSVSWKNLFGTGQDISLSYDRGLVGGAIANWNLEYNTHALKDYDFFRINFFNRFESGTEEEREYTITRTGGEISLGYPLGAGTQITLARRYEGFRKCFEEECDPPGITDSVTIGVQNDDRDNPLFPTQGGLRSAQVEQAGGFALGTEFTKLFFTLTQHFPTLQDQNIAFRFQGGVGFSLPGHERFLLGGPTTIRGMQGASTDKIFFMNAEYRVKLIEEVSIALFFDGGMGEGVEVMRSFGLDFRVRTPLGLVRFIVAWPQKDGFEIAPVFSFAFGPMF